MNDGITGYILFLMGYYIHCITFDFWIYMITIDSKIITVSSWSLGIFSEGLLHIGRQID